MIADGFEKLELELQEKKSLFITTSKELEAQLLEAWKGRGFKRTESMRNVGTDATLRRRRLAPIARSRLGAAAKRAKRLLVLRRAGAEVQRIHRAGPISAGTWGASVSGISPGELHGLRVQALNSMCRPKKGASTALRLAAMPDGRRYDPVKIYHAKVVHDWAQAVWEQNP